MEYAWDDLKSAGNLAKHGVSFEIVKGFDWLKAMEYAQDHDGEVRWKAFSWIGGVLHCLVYTHREPDITRVISLRKATPKERKFYEKNTPKT